jgi:hypothetical protein
MKAPDSTIVVEERPPKPHDATCSPEMRCAIARTTTDSGPRRPMLEMLDDEGRRLLRELIEHRREVDQATAGPRRWEPIGEKLKLITELTRQFAHLYPIAEDSQQQRLLESKASEEIWEVVVRNYHQSYVQDALA